MSLTDKTIDVCRQLEAAGLNVMVDEGNPKKGKHLTLTVIGAPAQFEAVIQAPLAPIQTALLQIVRHEEGPGYQCEIGSGTVGCDECADMKRIAEAALSPDAGKALLERIHTAEELATHQADEIRRLREKLFWSQMVFHTIATYTKESFIEGHALNGRRVMEETLGNVPEQDRKIGFEATYLPKEVADRLISYATYAATAYKELGFTVEEDIAAIQRGMVQATPAAPRESEKGEQR